MIDIILLIPLIVSFFTVFLIIPLWIKKASKIGLLWEDMNKVNSKKIAGSGGIIVILGFLIACLIYISYRTLIVGSTEYLIEIFSWLLVIILLAGIGFIDDLLGWKHGGLSIPSRIFLIAFASIPLIVINAGKHIVDFPFLGIVDLGIIYPLIMIPIGIIGASTTYNFLAGFNGLEAGQGILLLSSLAIVAYFTSNSWIAFILLIMVFALLAFFTYNACPAKVFPGDALTLSIGGMIAISCILGNFERIAFFFFLPYILETILKLRGKLKMQSFGKPKKDNTLSLKYDKIYGLTHLSISLLQKIGVKPTEKKVVISIWLFQAVWIVLGFLIFGGFFNK